MKKCRFTFLLIISTLLTACSSEKQFENLPVEIDTESQVVKIEQVISDAQEEVQRTLPDAYLVFFSFIGQCSDLPKLQGEIRLDFARIQQSLFGDRTIFAETTISTVNQTLSIKTIDETEHYPNIEPLVIDGKSLQEIAHILHNYLVSKNSCTDTVVLTRVRTESPWLVRCGSPEVVILECIEIDPETGKVTELQ
jgi:hypothetical protein